ncbi:exosome complex component CSL4 isoform 2-T2 [Megaptera novaeangliae]
MAPPVRYCIPGERLCNLEEGSPGSGTYTRHGYIFSSLAGCLIKSSENGALPVISVMRETESQLLPDVGAIVTCKVSSINSRFAKVHILYVGSTPLKNSFRGTIRGHRFVPWSGKIPHAVEQLGPCATTAEPARLEPVLRNKRGHNSERPAHRDEEWPLLAATRESPRTEMKTQHSQK